LPSEITSAFLFAQLEAMEQIQIKRKKIWDRYYNGLSDFKKSINIDLPTLPDYSTNNSHMFYMICSDLKERTELLDFLKSKDIYAVFHYLSLHKSDYYSSKHDGRELLNSDRFSDSLVRLPFYADLTETEIDLVIKAIVDFFHER
jgi:dTDP-4-amino-4,6-dideoxygalactose transaminase